MKTSIITLLLIFGYSTYSFSQGPGQAGDRTLPKKNLTYGISQGDNKNSIHKKNCSEVEDKRVPGTNSIITSVQILDFSEDEGTLIMDPCRIEYDNSYTRPHLYTYLTSECIDIIAEKLMEFIIARLEDGERNTCKKVEIRFWKHIRDHSLTLEVWAEMDCAVDRIRSAYPNKDRLRNEWEETIIDEIKKILDPNPRQPKLRPPGMYILKFIDPKFDIFRKPENWHIIRDNDIICLEEMGEITPVWNFLPSGKVISVDENGIPENSNFGAPKYKNFAIRCIEEINGVYVAGSVNQVFEILALDDNKIVKDSRIIRYSGLALGINESIFPAKLLGWHTSPLDLKELPWKKATSPEKFLKFKEKLILSYAKDLTFTEFDVYYEMSIDDFVGYGFRMKGGFSLLFETWMYYWSFSHPKNIIPLHKNSGVYIVSAGLPSPVTTDPFGAGIDITVYGVFFTDGRTEVDYEGYVLRDGKLKRL